MLAPLTGKGQEEGRGHLFSSASLCRLLKYKTTPPAGRPGALGNKGGTRGEELLWFNKNYRMRKTERRRRAQPTPGRSTERDKAGCPRGMGREGSAACSPHSGGTGQHALGKNNPPAGTCTGKKGAARLPRADFLLAGGKGLQPPSPSPAFQACRGLGDTQDGEWNKINCF